jgi:hypothetical protein
MAIREQGDTVWVTTALDPWVAAYRCVRRDGALVVAEVRVFPREREGDIVDAAAEGLWSGRAEITPPGGLPSALLRALKPGSALREARGSAKKNFTIDAPITPPSAGMRWSEGVVPPPTIDQRLARVAVHYVLAHRADSRHTNQDVALKLGISDKKVTEDLRAARRKGILAPTSPGRSGGDMTDKGNDLLLEMLEQRRPAIEGAMRKAANDAGTIVEHLQVEGDDAQAEGEWQFQVAMQRYLTLMLIDWLMISIDDQGAVHLNWER